MYKCIVIDDEQHAIDGLKAYIDATPELVFHKSFTDPVLALKEIGRADAVDVIFIDVDMPKITGIELSKVIRDKTDKLIFTTAHSKYAYEAFETDADAYLLKPYSLGKFVITINKLFPATKSLEVANSENLHRQNDFFFVKSKEDDLKILKIKFADVVAVESRQNYIMIHTSLKNILTYMSLTEVAKILTAMPNFMQLHRSFLINQHHIEMIDGNLVKMVNGIRVSVGKGYRREFNAFVARGLIKVGRQ